MSQAKEIPFKPLTDDLRYAFTSALDSLKELNNDINNKKENILEKSKMLKDKIDLLSDNKAIKINPNLKSHCDQSEAEYTHITGVLSQEIAFHLEFYTKYLSEEHPKEVKIGNATSFEDYIIKTSKLLKNFTKKRRRELDILSSRYENGFNVQLRKVKTVESYVKTISEKKE